jgi:hypothetical protein
MGDPTHICIAARKGDRPAAPLAILDSLPLGSLLGDP